MPVGLRRCHGESFGCIQANLVELILCKYVIYLPLPLGIGAIVSHSLQFQTDKNFSSFQGLPLKHADQRESALLIKKKKKGPAYPSFSRNPLLCVCCTYIIVHHCMWRQTCKRGADLSCCSAACVVSALQMVPWRHTALWPASAGCDWETALPPPHLNWYLWGTPEALG